MPTKPRREGLLTIDHRNSPGISAELINATGRAAPIVGAGQIFESATITCAHCNVVVVLNPDRTRQRGYCRNCDHYVCDNPGCNSNCTPHAKTLDIMQENIFRVDSGYNLLY